MPREEAADGLLLLFRTLLMPLKEKLGLLLLFHMLLMPLKEKLVLVGDLLRIALEDAVLFGIVGGLHMQFIEGLQSCSQLREIAFVARI